MSQASAAKLAKTMVPPALEALLAVFSRRARESVVDHWHEFVENFEMEPLEFYELVHQELNQRQVPGLGTFCVTHAEGGTGSADRLYLRLDRHAGHFDICAAPFGTGFYFSYRYIVPTPVGVVMGILWGLGMIALVTGLATIFGYLHWLTAIPVGMGAMLLWTIAILSRRKETYHRMDTNLMYLATVPTVVKKIVEQVTLHQGVQLSQRVTASSQTDTLGVN